MTEFSGDAMNLTGKHLACSEVWGGDRRADHAVESPGRPGGPTLPLSVPLQPEGTFATFLCAATEYSLASP
jgi:hypothetical protein